MKIKVTLTATREYDVKDLREDFEDHFDEEGELLDADDLKEALLESIDDAQGEFIDDCPSRNVDVKGEILK